MAHAELYFGVLGPLEVRRDGVVLHVGGSKPRALLSLLLVNANEVLPAERVVDRLWGEQAPASAQKTLQAYVSRLRKVLHAGEDGGGVLQTRGPGYVLCIGGAQLDVRRFEALVGQAQQARGESAFERASGLMREALSLWRGPALADVAYEAWARAEISRLEELRLLALEQRIELDMACGRHRELIGELEGLVGLYPLREQLHAQLMLALHRADRKGEALAAYRRARGVLVDALGLEPGPRLRDLERTILEDDVTPGAVEPAADVASTTIATRPEVQCDQCGGAIASVARYCAACGAPSPAARLARESRKRVTVLFCDVGGSTELGERLDPEALRRVMRHYFDEIARIIARHGGTVEKFIGDAVMAVFGVPRVHEDDAVRAVRAAAEIRARRSQLARESGVELQLRTGINSGEVVVGGGPTLSTGDAVNVAARLEQAAEPDEILLGGGTYELVRDAVTVEPLPPLAVKGKREPLSSYRLLTIDPGAPGRARRLDARLVGRRRELRLLRDAFEQARADRRCQLFTLLGVAGVGKSRLAAEFLQSLEREATVIRGRCLGYGDGITFFPLVEALRELGAMAEGVLHLVNGGVASAGELFLEVRRLLERVAAERPLIVVIDDLQWAEEMLLDLLDHVADLSRGAPLQLVCLARPELLDARPGWGGGKLNATTLLLEPLEREECEQLLAQQVGALDDELRAGIVAGSQGNPLFLEELAALAADHQGELRVPSSIRALLAARLDQLSDAERAVLEHGAIEGEIFHRGAVVHLAERVGSVDRDLVSLVRKDLVRPDQAVIATDEAYRFRHLLVRDAAYDALSKQTRAELHERFAGWLVEHASSMLELDELAGWHLEQAVGYRREIGLSEDPRVAVAAADHLARAGSAASARCDDAAAEKLLTRAQQLLAVDDPRRDAVTLSLGETLVRRGRYGAAAAQIDELMRRADPLSAAKTALVQLKLLQATDPERWAVLADERLDAVTNELRQVGDERWLAVAYRQSGELESVRGRQHEAALHAAQSVALARRAGDGRSLVGGAGLWGNALLAGSADRDALARFLAELEHESYPDIGYMIAKARCHEAMFDGRIDDARRFARAAEDGHRQIGRDVAAWGHKQEVGLVEILAGDYDAAIRELRHGWDELGRLGERGGRSGCGAYLAAALCLRGDLDEAEAMALAAEAEGGPDDLMNFVIGERVRAEVHLQRGVVGEAESLARAAVAYGARTEYVIFHADALVTLGRVLAARRNPDEAREAYRQALTLYEIKRHVIPIERTRALVADLVGV